MIEITRDIPKIYERVAVEEFYKYCQNVTKDKKITKKKTNQSRRKRGYVSPHKRKKKKKK